LKGGGTVFGPRPRVHNVKMTKKMRKLARKSALSLKATDEAITLIEDFSFEAPKTSKVSDILKAFEIENKKVLLLTADTDINIYKSARNIPGVQVLEGNKATTYQILDADVLLMQKGAVDALQESIENTTEEAA